MVVVSVRFWDLKDRMGLPTQATMPLTESIWCLEIIIGADGVCRCLTEWVCGFRLACVTICTTVSKSLYLISGPVQSGWLLSRTHIHKE